MDDNAGDDKSVSIKRFHSPEEKRAYFLEALFQMIIHCADDGNRKKIGKIIDNLYALHLMPVTQDDLDRFQEEFTRPTSTSAYYVVDDKRLDWIRQNDVAHTILRSDEHGLTELVFNDTQGDARFRQHWLS